MKREWVTHLRDECRDAGVPFFFKQWGGRHSKAGGRELEGRTWDEMPVVYSPSLNSIGFRDYPKFIAAGNKA